MRRFAVLVTSLAVVAGLVTIRPVQVVTVSRDAPLSHIAVIGDSYTTGTNIGGMGNKGWPTQAWRDLARQGKPVAADVASEGRAGYAVRGDHGSLFVDLTARAVRPDDVLVVFFGSRNDEPADPLALSGMAWSAFDSARRAAPAAKLLVIGPPWPTADVPDKVLQIRDALGNVARAFGAVFIDPIAERWFVGRPDLIGSDGVHPTDAGHTYLADRIASLVGDQLPAAP
ncbi:SGNH/GDSL hydrolase family protein [Mycolicibacterium cosmeticum]|uniref:Lysophospholipase L1-like esterase n=1 Tax=Mycolicibacterium cosmeticum TaxID=258533 RepID=W9BL50_MYCCO|nr:SGNH/GDSL hydrolase family protein [Mycolicibacterium cosmeticum]CDO09035.1 lysophospholipase L1-like esterase [Mycolicibacterium cosmeticum]